MGDMTGTNIKVSLCILNWNGLSFTRKCLKSLLKNPYPSSEIILVDNGSLGDEADTIEKEFGNNIRLIRNTKNKGYAEGMNQAMRASRGEYIMLLNNDMEFPKGWLAPLVQVLETHPEISAVSPKVRDMKDPTKFEYASAAGSYIDAIGFPFSRGRLFTTVEKDRGQYDTVVPICWAGVFLVRKSILKTIGVFNPIYFHNMEDIDLSLRIWGTGGSMLYEPKSIVYHFGGAVIARNPAYKFYYLHRNNVILILINWPRSIVVPMVVLRLMLDFVAIFFYIATRGYGQAWSVARSFASLVVMFPEIMASRRRTQKIINPKLLKRMPMYYGSIVWDYYIRGIKTYGDL